MLNTDCRAEPKGPSKSHLQHLRSIRPDVVRKYVQDVPAQRMALGDVWVIEIQFRAMFHSDFFHDAAGTHVGGDRDGHDFAQT